MRLHFLSEIAKVGSRLVVLMATALAISATTADAQVFGEGGLFNRKNKGQPGLSQDEIGVPIPVTGKVEALKGHEVTFELTAKTKSPASTVEFLIRTFPSAGKIVSMVSKPSERNKVLVTYYADPNSGATADAFAFAVKYRGGRYSSSMRFDIDLVDHKADIVVTEALNFGEVMVGEEVVKEITVANGGDGSFSRQLYLAAPWHLLEPSDGQLMIGPGGRRKVKVAFRPELSGETSYFLSFSRSKRGTTKLEGAGKPSFELVTKELELVLNEETHQREGDIVLMNHSAKPLQVRTEASSRLMGSLNEAYLLAPQQETRIPVNLWRTDTAPFDGAVQFSMKTGYAHVAKVVAKVVPGRIEVSVPGAISSEVINFGQVQGGKGTERQITIANPGGVPVPLEFHIPEPFRLLNNPGPSLGSMSSVNLSVGLYPTRNHRGSVDVTMKVLANEQSVPIRLLGNVVKPEGGVVAPGSEKGSMISALEGVRLSAGLPAPRDEPGNVAVGRGGPDVDPIREMPVEVPVDEPSTLPHLHSVQGDDWRESLSDEQAAKMATSSGRLALPLKERRFKADLRRPEDLSIVSLGSGYVTIGWTAPRDSELCRFEIEMLGLLLPEEGKLPLSTWVPHEQVEIERIGRLVKAKIKGLAPASDYEMRVLMVDENDRSSAPSEGISVTTELPMDWTYIYAFTGVACLIGLVTGIVVVIRRRQPEVYEAKYADL